MLNALLSAAIILVDRRADAGIDFKNLFGGADKRLIYETLGSGAAFVDYDGDGFLDIYLVNGAPDLASTGPGSRLYRNGGDGRFTDVTEPSGAGDDGFGVGIAAADLDADGDTDLFLAANGSDVLLLNQGDGTFRKQRAGDDGMAGGAGFGDYDADGLPDLYVSNYVERAAFEEGGKGLELCNWKGLHVGCGPSGLPASPDVLYHNDEGRLRDASMETGIGAVEPSYGLGVLFSDLDSDGKVDIYVANDGRPHYLFRNKGDGTFSEEGLMRGASYSGDGREQAGMGVDSGDIDSDSDSDLVVTNFSHDHTTLYENLGAGFFSDASYKRGIGKDTYFPLSWGVRFADLDSDSDVDLYVAHGHIYPEVDRVAPETSYAEPDQVFRNDGRGYFSLEPFRSSRLSSRGLSAGDYDNDGRIDLLVTTIDGPPELLHNESEPSGTGLLVALVGTKSTREGLGARVTVETSSGRQSQEARTSGSHASASDPRLHFGLGSAP
ncbi:MAG TPA: CRTAC1 family protein, partial [Vicinamibacteria bacterium]|nr:CRTAC1 family protein [Vicinamibacteria bacterium]